MLQNIKFFIDLLLQSKEPCVNMYKNLRKIFHNCYKIELK